MSRVRVGYSRGLTMEGMTVPNKIRKRGCSSSSSPSSIIRNKRTILVGKNRAGLGFALRRSRSTTPVPVWRTTPLRSTVDSPDAGKSSRPVSARSLAATLWEMNQMPSPKQHRKNNSKMLFKHSESETGTGSMPSHLPDPHYSPTVSEKMDRSENSRRRTTNFVPCCSEMETRSRPPTVMVMSSSSTNRLKDVSNALTTSKELLKIMKRIWGRTDDEPSSTMSLIAALHSELERARLHVNHLINEQRSDKDEMMKCFAEEKALWKSKEEEAIQAAMMERKSRRRVESLNRELGEVKLAYSKAEREKRAREITEKVCDELARNINEVELADKLREERVRMKLSDAKFHFEENNSTVAKLRKQLEVFLQTKDEENVDNNDGQGHKWNSSLPRNKSVSRSCYVRDEYNSPLHQFDHCL